MSEETLSKAELTLIDKIIGSLGLSSLRNSLWKRVEQAFRFTFKNTQVKYGFTHATPDPLALEYLGERVFILSDKTRDRLTGDLRWELLEGIRNTESISDIKKRLEPIFTRMHDYEIERIARTETLNAMNAGRLEAYEASEVTHYKMWRAAINNKRTAEDSRRLHGQIQELSDPFVDPKTGEGVMHPPNRPNCRCTMIPLRKLPENVVYKSGQMYAADEMVGKIEIDIGSLSKTEKRIWVKATAKRKGHYRKVKGAKKVEEPKFAMDRLKSIIPNVYLEGATESQLESIAKGVEETLSGFSDVKIDSIGWSTPDDEMLYGTPDAAYLPSTRSNPNPRIIVRKEVATDIGAWSEKAEKKFDAKKEINIDHYHDMIKGYMSWGEPERVVEYEEKLKNVNVCSRLFVSLTQKDKLKSIIVHECYHAIDMQMELENIFLDQLKKMGVTKLDEMMVSDYAASKETELWAEVGSAIDSGVDIPDSVRQAFENTMGTIR